MVPSFPFSSEGLVHRGCYLCLHYRSVPSSPPLPATVLTSPSPFSSAKTLKHLLRQSRPDTHRPSSSTKALSRKVPKSVAGVPTYGMPSTHSTTITCSFSFGSSEWRRSSRTVSIDYATYIIMATWRTSPYQSVGALLLGSLIAWSRIKLGHHTLPQVIAGVSLGITLGVTHFAMWHGVGRLGFPGVGLVGEGYWDLAEVVMHRVKGQIRSA